MKVVSDMAGALRDCSADYFSGQNDRLNHKCRVTYNDFCRQPCAVCGLTMPPWEPPGRVMGAHHRDPSSKEYEPSQLSRRGNAWWETLVAELRKCEPVCANCHGVIHDLVASKHHVGIPDWGEILSISKEIVAQWKVPGVGR